MNVLLTGATGFVGRALAERLQQVPDIDLTSVVRHRPVTARGRLVTIGGMHQETDWTEAVTGQDVVIHAAARAHVMNEEVADPLAEYRRVNVGGTLSLARQAASSGVKRLIFISSVKVNGEHTPPGRPFTADDVPAPEDAYGISKMEAEQGLERIARETGIEVVIIRPPLVYGPGVKGNFANMIRIVEKGWPLPLGSIHNKRTLVGLDNLTDLVATCMSHPAAANQVFLAGDGEDVSTTELLRRVAGAMGRKVHLIPFPASLIRLAASVTGKSAIADRLLGSLQLDLAKNRTVLGWVPPISMHAGMQRCFSSEKGS